MEQQLVAEQQQHHELAERCQVLESKLADYEQTVACLEEEIKSKDHILAEVHLNVEERAQQLETQRAEFEAKQQTASQTSVDLEAAIETIRTLEIEISNRDTTIQNIHRDIEYKEQKMSEVMATSLQNVQLVSDMESRLSAQNEEMERLNCDLETGHQELQQMRAEVDKFHEAGVTVDVCQQLREQNATLQSSVTELKEELAGLRTSLDLSQNECQQLRSNLSVASASDTEHKAVVSSLEARLMGIDMQSQEEISRWKEKVSFLSDDLSSCVAELDQLKECRRIAAEEKDSLQVALSGKDEKLQTLRLQLEAGEESVYQVRMELEEAASAHQMSMGKLQRQVSDAELRVKDMEELVQSKDDLVAGMRTELEDTRKKLEDMKNQNAEHQQVFVDRETLLSNTVATLHQQLEESTANIELLATQCMERDAEVQALKKKLDDRDTKIASLSENFKEEELQLVALTEELEACKTQAAKDRVLAESEFQKIVQSKDAEITVLTGSSHNQETQLKKYVAVIKKLKQQLQDEKGKREGLEKQSVSSLDDSGTSDERLAVSGEVERSASPAVLSQSPVSSTNVASSESSCLKPSDMDQIKTAAEHQISELKETNEQLRIEISKLESQSDEYETIVKHLNGVAVGLKEENDVLKVNTSDAGQMRNDIARLESEKSNAVANLEAVSSELTKLKSDLDASLKDVEQLNAQLSDEIAAKESVKHELDCCKEILGKVQIEHTNVIEERTRLERQSAVTRETLQQLSDDNAQLRMSCETVNEELQLLKTEAEAAKIIQTTDRHQTEYQEKEVNRHMQLEVNKLHQASAGDSCKSAEEYSALETENLHLTERCNSLIKYLEEEQNKHKAFVVSATEKEEHLTKESEKLLGKLKVVEDKNTILEKSLKEMEFNYSKNFDAFKKIQNELEAEKVRLETELERLTNIVLKSEGTIQQLVAELGAEREEFSLRESELEGSSEELQLEVVRLAQKVETDTDELESLRSRNKEMEMQLQSWTSNKDSVDRQINECLEQNRKLAQENELLKTECKELHQDKEQLAREVQSNQDMAERKHATLSDQYDMLSTDISNYQELVESLHSKNSQLEQQLQKSLADDASHATVSRELEVERERMEDERRVHSQEVESFRAHESELLCEIKRLQMLIEQSSSTKAELLESRSHVSALQTENDSLRRNILELEQRVQELAAVEDEQSALQERYLSLLQDNSALIRQSKDLYEKLRSVNESANNSADQSAAEVTALKAEVEMLRREHEHISLRDRDCEQLRSELLALQASAQQQSSSDKSENREFSTQAGEHYPAVEHICSAVHQPIETDARVHAVQVHSSSPHRKTSDDRSHEIIRLKTQVTAGPVFALSVIF